MSIVLELVVEGKEAAAQVIDFYQKVQGGQEAVIKPTTEWAKQVKNVGKEITDASKATEGWQATITGLNQGWELAEKVWGKVKFVVTELLSPIQHVYELFERVVVVSAEYDDELAKMARITGATAFEMERLSQAGYSLAGMATGPMTEALAMLTRQMFMAQNGSKMAQEAFKDIGVEFASGGKLRNVTAVLADIATKFSAADDGAVKTAISMKLFRGASADMLEMLNSGGPAILEAADRMDKLHLATDKTGYEFGNKLVPALREAKQDVDGLWHKLGNELVPEFEKAFETVKQFGEGLIKEINWQHVRQDIGLVVVAVGDFMKILMDVSPVFFALAQVGTQVTAAIIGGFEGLAYAVDKSLSIVTYGIAKAADAVGMTGLAGKMYQLSATLEHGADTSKMYVQHIRTMANDVDRLGYAAYDMGHKIADATIKAGDGLQHEKEKVAETNAEHVKLNTSLGDEANVLAKTTDAVKADAAATGGLADSTKKADEAVQSLTHHTSEWKATAENTKAEVVDLSKVMEDNAMKQMQVQAFYRDIAAGKTPTSMPTVDDPSAMKGMANAAYTQAMSHLTTSGEAPNISDAQKALLEPGQLKALENGARTAQIRALLFPSSGGVSAVKGSSTSSGGGGGGGSSGGGGGGDDGGFQGFGQVTQMADMSGGKGADFLSSFEQWGGGSPGIGGGPGSIGRMMYGMGSSFEGDAFNAWANGGYEKYKANVALKKKVDDDWSEHLKAITRNAQEDQQRQFVEGAQRTENARQAAAQKEAQTAAIYQAQALKEMYGDAIPESVVQAVKAQRDLIANTNAVASSFNGASSAIDGYISRQRLLGGSSFRGVSTTADFINRQKSDGRLT